MMMVGAREPASSRRTYDEWEATVPGTLRADAIWKVQAYRLASYVACEAGSDADKAAERPWLVKAAGQLASAAESVPANIAEGYARLSPKDRIRYHEYALGTAAETKSRYVTLSRRFEPSLVDARLDVLASIGRLVLKMIQSGRVKPLPPEAPPPPREP